MILFAMLVAILENIDPPTLPQTDWRQGIASGLMGAAVLLLALAATILWFAVGWVKVGLGLDKDAERDKSKLRRSSLIDLDWYFERLREDLSAENWSQARKRYKMIAKYGDSTWADSAYRLIRACNPTLAAEIELEDYGPVVT